MKKITYLLGLAAFCFSCSSNPEDTNPEPVIIPFTVGMDNQENVTYSSPNLELLFGSDQELSILNVDLDQDGTDDLRFSLTSSQSEDTQLLEVRPLNDTRLARQDERFEFGVTNLNYIQLSAPGNTLVEEDFIWTIDQSLFMLQRTLNASLSAGPGFVYTSGFLPLILKDKLGWVEFEALTNEPALDINGISIKRIALKD